MSIIPQYDAAGNRLVGAGAVNMAGPGLTTPTHDADETMESFGVAATDARNPEGKQEAEAWLKQLLSQRTP